MTTRDVIESYLESVRAKHGWEDFLSDEIEFTNFTHPVKRVVGKQASLEGIRRFYSMVKGLEVKAIIVEGGRACALTRYDLQTPGGNGFESNIAEIFEVDDDQITSLGIYFDSAPYPKPRDPAH